MTDQVIIDAAERFGKKPLPPAAKLMPEGGATFKTAMKMLPFVSPKWKNEYWPESMWMDEPTDNHLADCERGREFAKLTLGAMLADGQCCDGRTLAVIFETIVADCARRRAKGGKGCQSLPGAVYGYLEVLANFITAQRRRGGPPAA
jgi:hypothetical protein